MTNLRNLITDNREFRENLIRYLIWVEHRFEFPIEKLEKKLSLPEPIIIEMMNYYNQQLKRYKRKSRMWRK